ncbi:MAG: ATP-binding cassette domain-containing protein [Thermoguttaceae bacterium]|nr:ATP-binding cassette domain-containing protein [Thermoguttaceae bacterium]MDW8077308.1 ATP-binding cassette domain-containing protein [Thermoguttaceae bacterium]
MRFLPGQWMQVAVLGNDKSKAENTGFASFSGRMNFQLAATAPELAQPQWPGAERGPVLVEVHDLVKDFPDVRRKIIRAVDHISFRVRAGEIFGLLGPNGAGKTTTLRILSTILRPTAGSAQVLGKDVTAHPAEVRRAIGFVSTSTAIYDRMTGRELVVYFGQLHGLTRREAQRRADALFERLGLSDPDRLGAKMSSGMKQKVSIARALVHDPPVLIFDEPTVGLDVLAARAVLEIISELRKEGKCIIFSTHIMREAEKLCDRIAILHEGKILAEGTLQELRERTGQSDLEELFFQLITASKTPLAVNY